MRGLRILLVFLALLLLVCACMGYEHETHQPYVPPAPLILVPTATPSPQAPSITGVGVATDTNPWIFWVSGTNFAPEDVLFARLTDTNGSPWTTVFAAQTPSYGRGLLRFSLPSNVPPSGCDRGKPCTVSLTIFDATTGLASAPVALTLPDPA